MVGLLLAAVAHTNRGKSRNSLSRKWVLVLAVLKRRQYMAELCTYVYWQTLTRISILTVERRNPEEVIKNCRTVNGTQTAAQGSVFGVDGGRNMYKYVRSCTMTRRQYICTWQTYK